MRRFRLLSLVVGMLTASAVLWLNVRETTEFDAAAVVMLNLPKDPKSFRYFRCDRGWPFTYQYCYGAQTEVSPDRAPEDMALEIYLIKKNASLDVTTLPGGALLVRSMRTNKVPYAAGGNGVMGFVLVVCAMVGCEFVLRRRDARAGAARGYAAPSGA